MNDVFRGIIDAQAENLLSGYHSDDPFFFATPEHTLLTRGHYATVPQPTSGSSLSETVDLALKQARERGHPNPIVVGAIPFDTGQAARLSIPHHVLSAGPLTRRTASAPLRTPKCTVTPQPAPQVYADGVAQAVRQIQDGVLRKVVLARTLELASEETIDVPCLLERLARRNTHGYTFALNLAATGQGTLVGASPELLLSRRGLQVRSNPLAGSAARVREPLADAQRSQALLLSAKDLHEHQLVADAVAQGLRPHCKVLEVPAAPSLIHTETMWHLSSDIRGELASPEASALFLASCLHPTPAVCGYPSDQALALIRQIEPFNRGFYSGMVGWCDAEGNGEWVVTLRCALVQGQHMRLFAGAGVVAESQPASELAETSAKFKTMLNALGMAAQETL